MILVKTGRHPSWGFFQETAAKLVLRHSVYFGISDLPLDNSNQQLSWVDNMTGASSDAGLFPCFTLPTPTILTMGDLQQPFQFLQPGVSTCSIGMALL